MLAMDSYLHTTIEFYSESYSTLPLTGYVISDIEPRLEVRIEHGPYHGQVIEIDKKDIIDNSYDSYDTDNERTYAWWNEE